MRLNYQNNLDIWANKNLNTKERQAPEQSYVNNVFSNITGHYDQMNTIMTLGMHHLCLLYTSPSPRDATLSRMPSSA